MSAHAKLAFVTSVNRIASDVAAGVGFRFGKPTVDHADRCAKFPILETGWLLVLWHDASEGSWDARVGYRNSWSGELIDPFSALVFGGAEDVAPALIQEMLRRTLERFERLEVMLADSKEQVGA